jgi:thiamine-monophosphate kinase
VTRAGARPGDAICVTGALGGAAGGLLALRRGLTEAAAGRRLAQRQLRPEARVAAGAVLAAHASSAAIDVSDGLLLDLDRLAHASGVGFAVDPGAVPVDSDLLWLHEELAECPDPQLLAATGGEDYELLFTIDPQRLPGARGDLEAHGARAHRIGTIVKRARTFGARRVSDMEELGWQHLRSR